MNSQLFFWLFLAVFVVFLTEVEPNIITRVKRQWGFGYPLFGGIGNSWEVPSNFPTYWGYNAMAGK